VLEAPNPFGRTPADFAASAGHLHVMKYLHSVVPTSLSGMDDSGFTPAHGAAVHGHSEVLRFLHEVAPATLVAADKHGRVPADYAAQQMMEGAQQVLAELGADIPFEPAQ